MRARRSSGHTLAILTALLVSVGLHGLLFLAVWLSPASAMPAPSKRLSVELVSHSSSTRPSTRKVAPAAEEEEADIFTASTLAPAPAYPTINIKDPELTVGSASKGPGLATSKVEESQGAATGSTAGAAGLGAGEVSPSTVGGTGRKWFPDADKARCVVYAIDRSLSMGTDAAFASARLAVIDSLHHLPAGTRFQIIAYNRKAEPLSILGRMNLVEVSPESIHDAARLLEQLEAFGNTDHGAALERALVLKPDLLYLVTDGGDLSPTLVEALTKKNGGRTVIHTVEVSRWQGPTAGRPLQVLSARNRGSYQLLAPR